MSEFENLIQTLCPDGVEYKPLGEIGRVAMCKRIMKNETTVDGDVPFFKIGTFGGVPDAYITKAKFEEYKNKYSYPKKGDILISAAGTIGRTVIFDGEPAYFQDSNIVWLEHNEQQVLNKYLFYIYQTSPWQVTASGTIARIYNDNIKQAIIPVPPLKIQEEIVDILDAFTELQQCLQEELKLRKIQYEYYRDELLSAQTENTRYVKLGEIATITRGGNFQKKDFCAEGIPCIHYGQIYTKFNLYTYEPITYISEEIANKSKKATTNDIIMAVTSENIEDVCKCVAWLGDSDIAVSGHTAIIHHNQNAKYLSHFFHTQMFFEQKKEYAHGTKVIEVIPSKLENIVIPLPPLEEQERIVEILDPFEKLCNDRNTGILAEIEARKKQYEYYRDKILSFKEKAV